MKQNTALKVIALAVIVVIASSLFLYWQEEVSPKFSFRLAFEPRPGTSLDQYGYVFQNKTNSLNFTTTTNTTCFLYSDEFWNRGNTLIHNITVSIDGVSEGLAFGTGNYVDGKLQFKEIDSGLFPVEWWYGTLNSSDSRTNAYGFHIKTSTQGQYQIHCHISSQEFSFPFDITINVID